MKNIRNTNLKPIVLSLISALAGGNALALDIVAPALGGTSTTCIGNCGVTSIVDGIGALPIGTSNYGYVSTAGGVTGATTLGIKDENTSVIPQNLPTSSKLSTSFHAAQGAQMTISFNYITTDSSGFSDYAWARLTGPGAAGIFLFTAMSSTNGGNGLAPGGFDQNDIPKDSGTYTRPTDKGTFHSTASVGTVDWSPIGSDNKCYDKDRTGCGFTGWLDSNYSFSATGDYTLEFGVTNWGDNLKQSGLAFAIHGSAAGAGAGVGDSPAAAVPEPSTYAMMGTALLLFGANAMRRRRRA